MEQEILGFDYIISALYKVCAGGKGFPAIDTE